MVRKGLYYRLVWEVSPNCLYFKVETETRIKRDIKTYHKKVKLNTKYKGDGPAVKSLGCSQRTGVPFLVPTHIVATPIPGPQHRLFLAFIGTAGSWSTDRHVDNPTPSKQTQQEQEQKLARVYDFVFCTILATERAGGG